MLSPRQKRSFCFPPHGDVQPLRTLPPFPEADRQLSGGGADGPETPKPGRSVCSRTILKPAVRAIIRFPFFHVRQAISGKLNWEQILRKRLVQRR
jgi:hypothetical protein